MGSYGGRVVVLGALVGCGVPSQDDMAWEPDGSATGLSVGMTGECLD